MAIAVIEKLGTTLNVQLLADRLDSLQAPLPGQELKPFVCICCSTFRYVLSRYPSENTALILAYLA